MAGDELVVDGRDRVIDIEGAFFSRQLRDEDGFEQQISDFLGQGVAVLAIDGIDDFINLFDDERLEAGEGLRAVPRTAIPSAKPGHQLHDLAKGTLLHVASFYGWLSG